MADSTKFYVLRGDKVLFESMTKEQIHNAIVQAIEQGEIHDVDTGFITSVKEQNQSRDLKFWKGTQAQYNALPAIDPDTFYIFTNSEFEDSTRETLATHTAQINRLTERVDFINEWDQMIFDSIETIVSTVEGHTTSIQGLQTSVSGLDTKITNSRMKTTEFSYTNYSNGSSQSANYTADLTPGMNRITITWRRGCAVYLCSSRSASNCDIYLQSVSQSVQSGNPGNTSYNDAIPALNVVSYSNRTLTYNVETNSNSSYIVYITVENLEGFAG